MQKTKNVKEPEQDRVFKLELCPCNVKNAFNPYKSNVLFVGLWQRVQNQIRRHRTWRLIRFCTACIHNIRLKFE